MRDCQFEGNMALELSFMRDALRSLVQMATGSGKTYLSCACSYRLIKFANAHRILFLVDRNNLLDAIGNLGAMNTHEAAVRLTQFLVLINSYTEKGKSYDDAVVFAVLQNLGALADKVAFDDLMYTQYLNYSTGVNTLFWLTRKAAEIL